MGIYSEDQRESMKKFIHRMFLGEVEDSEISTDEGLQKVYDEACNYSDWGL